MSNATCVCRGERVTAVEFVETLNVWLRALSASRAEHPTIDSNHRRVMSPKTREHLSNAAQRRWARERERIAS